VRLEIGIEEELLSSVVNSSIRFCGSYTTSILFSELVVVVSEEAWTRIMLPLPEVKLQLWDDPCMLHSPLPELRDLKPCLALLLNCISASAILSYEVPILDKILSICLLLLFTRCLPAVSLFVAL
jgi:hypothetical protein